MRPAMTPPELMEFIQGFNILNPDEARLMIIALQNLIQLNVLIHNYTISWNHMQEVIRGEQVSQYLLAMIPVDNDDNDEGEQNDEPSLPFAG